MFLIPVVGGLLAGLIIKQLRLALIATAVLWVATSASLLLLAASEDDVTVGTWIVILIGLLGFLLAWGAHAIRHRGRSM